MMEEFVMNEYPEPQKNISLMDLIFYCLEKWRWIVACMLITAIVAGTYKYQETVKENQLAQRESDEIPIEEIEKDESFQSVKYYEQAIEEIEKELKTQEDYLKNSVVMQMNSYHISTGTLNYFVESSEYVSSVLAAYSSFVSSGRMAEALYSSVTNIPVEDLQYLISFINNTSEVYSLDNSAKVIYNIEDSQAIASSGSGSAIFQIKIRTPESGQSESYLNRAIEIMEEYASELQKEVADHKLTLLSSVQSEMTDSDIQEYQSIIRSAYTTSVRGLQTLQTELQTLQGTQGVQGTHSSTFTLKNPVSSAVNFAVFGLIVGTFLACIILLVVYILGGKLQDTEEFQEEFGMPLLGIVRVSANKRKLFGIVDNWVFRMRGGIYGKVGYEEQVKIVAANVQTAITCSFHDKEIKKIMVSGTVTEKDISALCIHLASELTEASLSPYKQIVFQSSALRELEDYDGILFLEKRGSSDSSFILQEKKIALDRNVKVFGTVVVC